MRDKIFLGMLILIAGLLVLNLIKGQEVAQGDPGGYAMACSSSGQFVYAAGGGHFYFSDNYGQRGSWGVGFP